MKKSALNSILSSEKIQTAFLLFLVLFIGFYNLSRTDELRYVDEKAKTITSNEQLQKNLIETNKKYYRDENEQTYLIGPDPYLYYRIARNLVELGTINDSVKPQVVLKNNSYVEEYLQSDSLRFAPAGTIMQKEFMPYAIYYFHQVWNFFSNATLSKTAFYLPVFLGMISIIAIFFFVLITTKSKNAAFFSSFFLALNPTFVAFN
ncbi:MAG: STT3 domain-containing protein, partial [Nanoarchaeota archaeon]